PRSALRAATSRQSSAPAASAGVRRPSGNVRSMTYRGLGASRGRVGRAAPTLGAGAARARPGGHTDSGCSAAQLGGPPLPPRPAWRTMRPMASTPTASPGATGADRLEREAALAALGEAFARAHRGTGRLVLVGGEAGIGKSALVQAFCAEPGRR